MQHFNAFHGPKCQSTKLGCIGDMGLVEVAPWEFILLTMGQAGGRDTVKKQILEQLVSASACLQAACEDPSVYENQRLDL